MDKSTFFEPLIEATRVPDDFKKTDLPDWDISLIVSELAPTNKDADSCWKCFKERFQTVKGIACENPTELIALLKEQGITKGYLDPALSDALKAELTANQFELMHSFDSSVIDSYQFGITRAAGMIAETGTVVLKEQTTASRLAALAPWVHIAIADSNTPIYPTLHDAIADFGDDPYIVFATGPSKTADVEGILIQGVHGPGIQVCCKI